MKSKKPGLLYTVVVLLLNCVVFLIAIGVFYTWPELLLPYILTVVVGVVILLVKAYKNADKEKFKKKLKVIILSFLGLCITVITVGFVINLLIPTLSQEEVEKIVLEKLEPQLELIEGELGVSDVSVELTIHDYEYVKPTIFSQGSISFEVDSYYVSKYFTELDNEDYNDATYDKYCGIDNLSYESIEIPKYDVSIKQKNILSEPDFKDGSGDVYSFYDDKIVKNGSYVYKKPIDTTIVVGSNNDEDDTGTCPCCKGTEK